MKLDFGDLECIYCNSSNIEFCDWDYDEQSEDIEDIYFMSQVENHIKENFYQNPEQKFLFHCKDCKKWFTLKTEVEETCENLLPFSEEDKISPNCYLFLNPFDLSPESLQINNVNVSIYNYEYHYKKEPYPLFNRVGPFYPYPLGTFDLICTIDKSIVDAPAFNLRISNKSGALFHSTKNIDLEFFKFSIDYYNQNGKEALGHILNINKSFDDSYFDEFIDNRINNLPYSPDDVPRDISNSISLVASKLRNIQAYNFLNWLENQLRNFVWEEYKNIYSEQTNSSKWWKGCFPVEVINKIKENQENDNKLGLEINYKFPLEYTDFDNLLILIEKEWSVINKKLKKDLDAIKGHFRYLKHFRNTVAHSRYLSHQDLMELQSNALRFMTMLGINQFNQDKFIFYKNIDTIY